jgi:hypothetical protein
MVSLQKMINVKLFMDFLGCETDILVLIKCKVKLGRTD